VCHWEFPKYISPCVLLSAEEWPEFHSFLHLFLRFHKRREGDRVSGSLFIIRRGASLPRVRAKPGALSSRFASQRVLRAWHCGKEEKLGKIRVASGESAVSEISLAARRVPRERSSARLDRDRPAHRSRISANPRRNDPLSFPPSLAPLLSLARLAPRVRLKFRDDLENACVTSADTYPFSRARE